MKSFSNTQGQEHTGHRYCGLFCRDRFLFDSMMLHADPVRIARSVISSPSALKRISFEIAKNCRRYIGREQFNTLVRSIGAVSEEVTSSLLSSI